MKPRLSSVPELLSKCPLIARRGYPRLGIRRKDENGI